MLRHLCLHQVLAMSERPYDLILFDVDHTLLDFEASEENALKRCWAEYFQDAVEFENYATAFRKINLGIWHEVESGRLKPEQVSEERARRTLRHFGFRGGRAVELGNQFAAGLAAVAQWLPGAEVGFQSVASRSRRMEPTKPMSRL